MAVDLSSIEAILKTLAPVLEPLIMNLEQNQIQPELKAIIAGVSSPDLKALFLALDAGLDSFAQTEIQKL